MGDTFNAFVKFISDDPIMLGLCIAIIVLIIAFILVLFLGRKKDDKEAVEDTTKELLKTEINMEALKSTQEFSLNELQNEQSNVPVFDTPENIETFKKEDFSTSKITETPVEQIEQKSDMEVPVAIESNPTSLEVPNVTNGLETAPIIETPNYSFDSLKIETTPNINTSNREVTSAGLTNDTSLISEPFKEVPAEQKIDEPNISPIIESVVSPVDAPTFPSFDTMAVDSKPTIQNTETPQLASTLENETKRIEPELPTMNEPVPKPIEPFSSVNVDANAELPSINTEDFSRTEIIRHIPIMEATKPLEPNTTNDEDDLDDIDLPMLNANDKDETPLKENALSALQGETFNI